MRLKLKYLTFLGGVVLFVLLIGLGWYGVTVSPLKRKYIVFVIYFIIATVITVMLIWYQKAAAQGDAVAYGVLTLSQAFNNHSKRHKT